jgi:hypothetical protein
MNDARILAAVESKRSATFATLHFVHDHPELAHGSTSASVTSLTCWRAPVSRSSAGSIAGMLTAFRGTLFGGRVGRSVGLVALRGSPASSELPPLPLSKTLLVSSLPPTSQEAVPAAVGRRRRSREPCQKTSLDVAVVARTTDESEMCPRVFRQATMSVLQAFRGSPLTDSNRRPPPYHFSGETIPSPVRLESPRTAPNLSPQSVPKMALICPDSVCAASPQAPAGGAHPMAVQSEPPPWPLTVFSPPLG